MADAKKTDSRSAHGELDAIGAALIERIRGRAGGLTARQRAVAEYVMQHFEDVGFLPIAELARRAAVSEATVVRFCQAIGYAGYFELGREVQERIHAQLSTEGRFLLSRRRSGGSTSALDRVVAHEAANLGRLTRGVDPGDFRRAVDWLARAERVAVIGCMASASLASYLGYMLSKIRPRVHVLTDADTAAFGVVSDLNRKAVAVLIAFPRYPAATVELGSRAAGAHAKVVAVTDSVLSPSVSPADLALLVPVGMALFVDSYAAPIALMNALVTALSERDPAARKRRLRAFDRYAAEMRLFAQAPKRQKAETTP